MQHIMRLDMGPFNEIKNDIKHFEYRLNDEKRQLIKVKDTIRFLKRPEEQEFIDVEVLELRHYPDLFSMCEDTFNDYLYLKYKTVQESVDAINYYSSEDIQKYGCLAIKIKLIKKLN